MSLKVYLVRLQLKTDEVSSVFDLSTDKAWWGRTKSLVFPPFFLFFKLRTNHMDIFWRSHFTSSVAPLSMGRPRRGRTSVVNRCATCHGFISGKVSSFELTEELATCLLLIGYVVSDAEVYSL